MNIIARRRGRQRQAQVDHHRATVCFGGSRARLQRAHRGGPHDGQVPEAVLEAEIEFTYSLLDPFLSKSKQLFAPDLAGDPQYGGTPFAVPLFSAQDVFYARGEQRDAWLELFGAYAAESRADHGILLWGRKEIEPVILECLRLLHEQELKYPTVPQP